MLTPLQRFKKSPAAHWIARSGIFLGIAMSAAMVGSLVAVNMPLPGAVSPKEGRRLLGDLVKSGFQYQVSRPVNVLVMGIDRVPGATDGSPESFSGRSDTMLLLRVDPKKESVSMLSIPRDTQVDVPGVGVTKINQANASGGPLLARESVSNALNHVKVDRYVRISTNAFRELVDKLGGVRVYVPQPMVYTDNTQKLNINLAQGWQTLNGSQAEQFARFRKDDLGDIGRVQRQQSMIKALRGQVNNPFTIARIPSIIRDMQKYVDSNLSFEEMVALVNFGLKMEQKDFKMVLLPGRFSSADEFRASYWIMDEAGRDRILQDQFQVTKANDEAPSIATPPESDPSLSLRIAVQNAADNPNAARRIANFLTEKGYQNVFVIEPWSEQENNTQVIAQNGQTKAAKSLRDLLNVGEVEATSTGNIDSDLTLRVGNDWAKAPLPKE
ncbi:MAG: LCP family protein [Alkalinema sp. RU_4_3]|nr:LCP family protein [Alkalinema sp. RU_4_3]